MTFMVVIICLHNGTYIKLNFYGEKLAFGNIFDIIKIKYKQCH